MNTPTRCDIPITDKYEYTVWVGGTEVTDFYVTFETAVSVAMHYIEDYYDNVVIDYTPEHEQPK